MLHKKDRCFRKKREKGKRFEGKIFHASLCTKRREGVFRLRLKREVSSTAKQIVHSEQKQNILQGMYKFT